MGAPKIVMPKNPLAYPQDPFYGKDVDPGPGGGQWIDACGELVTTTRWPHIQEGLRRIHPRLRLLFDRALGWWAIYRIDYDLIAMNLREIEGLRQGDLGRVQLAHHDPAPSDIAYIRWVRKVSREGGFSEIYYYREPGEWLLHNLSKMDRRDFEFHVDQRISEKLRAHVERMAHWQDQELKARSQAVISDNRFVMGREIVAVEDRPSNLGAKPERVGAR